MAILLSFLGGELLTKDQRWKVLAPIPRAVLLLDCPLARTAALTSYLPPLNDHGI